VNPVFLVCRLAFPVVFIPTCLLAAESSRAAVFCDELPGHEVIFACEIETQVSAAGYSVEFINTSTLTNAFGASES